MAHFKYIYIKFLQIKCQTKYCSSQNGKKKKERKQAPHGSIALPKSQSNVNSPRLKHPNLGTATKQALDGARGRKHLDWDARTYSSTGGEQRPGDYGVHAWAIKAILE